MTAFYNEFDKFPAQQIRELQSDGWITPGPVDERSIADLQPEDVAGHGRVHLFAGIGGWEPALALAGWPADRPVWTGSCPCQPFSVAGKKKGKGDSRDLWPEMFRLLAAERPQCVFGEQVPGAIKHGWIDRICTDLEGEGYTVCWVVLGAHSAGAPQIRQRIYWVAHRPSERWEQPRGDGSQSERGANEPGRLRADRSLADASSAECRRGAEPDGGPGKLLHTANRHPDGRLADATGVSSSKHVGEQRGGVWREAAENYAADCRGDHGADGDGNSLANTVGVGRNGGAPDAGTRTAGRVAAGRGSEVADELVDPQSGGEIAAQQRGQRNGAVGSGSVIVEHSAGDGRPQWWPQSIGGSIASGCRAGDGVGNTNNSGRVEQCWTVPVGPEQLASQLRSGDGPDAAAGLGAVPVRLRQLLVHDSPDARARLRVPADRGMGDGPIHNPWADSTWWPCRDPKRGLVWRRIPTQPGLFPLAHGFRNRVGALRGAGNAIVPQVAAVFIRAFLELEAEESQQ